MDRSGSRLCRTHLDIMARTETYPFGVLAERFSVQAFRDVKTNAALRASAKSAEITDQGIKRFARQNANFMPDTISTNDEAIAYAASFIWAARVEAFNNVLAGLHRDIVELGHDMDDFERGLSSLKHDNSRMKAALNG